MRVRFECVVAQVHTGRTSGTSVGNLGYIGRRKKGRRRGRLCPSIYEKILSAISLTPVSRFVIRISTNDFARDIFVRIFD